MLAALQPFVTPKQVQSYGSEIKRRNISCCCQRHSDKQQQAPQSAAHSKRIMLSGLAAAAAGVSVRWVAPEPSYAASSDRQGVFAFRDEEWRSKLTPEQYRVLREAGTEKRFSSQLVQEKRVGVFCCAGCGSQLFQSEAKYESGTGWPSFYQAIEGAVDLQPDNSLLFMPRTEVRCKSCQGHLGHVFSDGPQPTGLRYCMNGAAMSFQPARA